MFGRRRIATYVAEFLGTGVLTLLILTVQRSTIGVPFFVTMAAGLTFALMVFAFNRLSGAHFNPALTLGLWLARRVSTINAVLFIAMQLLGAFAASWLYIYFVKTHLQSIGGNFTWRIFTAEAVGTGILAFGVASALYQRFTVGATAAVSGLAYMLGALSASTASIGLINPAVALGARAWTWAYVLGPLAGAAVGALLYSLLFAETGTVVATEAVATGSTAASSVATSNTVRAGKAPAVKVVKKPRTTKRTTTTTRSTRKRS